VMLAGLFCKSGFSHGGSGAGAAVATTSGGVNLAVKTWPHRVH
jgi:hypothetical protein